MAYSTSSRHSGYAAVGVPQIAGSFDKFQMDASPKFNLGYQVVTGDGSIYKYSHFGADTNRGVLVATDASESSVVDTDDSIIAPASAVTVTDGTIGSKFIELTLASVTAGQYVGGKFVTTDDTGEGYTYDIVGNTATNDPATGNIRIELAQPLQVAVDATTDFAIQGSLYANLEIATAATDIAVAGVTCATMDVSEAAWGWVQTKGVCGILQDGTIAIGDIVTLSDGTDGAVQVGGGGGSYVADLVAEQLIGTCVIAGDTGGHGVFNIIL